MAFPTTRLMLIRHGETEANLAGQMQRRGDDPLTERGQQQVRAIAERIKNEPITAVYSSPLLRARMTADAITTTLGLPTNIRNGLQEMQLGDVEDVSARHMSTAVPVAPDLRYAGGESPRDFVERIMGALYGLVAAHPGESIVVVSHGGVTSTALSIWPLGHGGAWRDYIPSNCALSIVEFNAGPNIAVLNDCAHL